MAEHIQELSQNTKDTIRSTFIIQTLPSCIIELVQNALDAQARSIEVAVSVADWECRVTDNGHGIDARSLLLLGKRYYTSKQGARENGQNSTYGYRGEALCSIADMSLVEIITRHTSSTETFTAIIRGGETLYVGPAKHGHRSSSGTTVIIRDLFYKWPVRRKQAETSHNFQNATLSQIRKHLEALAIINHSVAFQLYDLSKQDASCISSVTLFSTTNTRSMADSLASLHSKTLVEHISQIDHTRPGCNVSGFFSLTSTHNKQTQFIYVNRRPITTCNLHQQINLLFDRSAFARRSEVEDRRYERELSPKPTPFLSKTNSPRKHANRYPVFCLCLQVPPDSVDFVSEPNKQLAHFQDEESVLKVLKEVVTTFLRDYGYLDAPAQVKSSPVKPTSSPTHLRVKRIKAMSTARSLAEPPDLPSLDVCSPAARTTGAEREARAVLAASRQSHTGSANMSMIYSSSPSRVENSRPPQVIDVKHLRRSDQETGTQTPEWLQNVLQGWQNPVFQPVQKPIRSVQAKPQARLEHFLSDVGWDTSQQYSLDKEMLHWYSFVAQIDCKFLLFTHQGPSETTLILVDQHAADERVRVEAFLREHCQQFQRNKVERFQISTAKLVLLSTREVKEAQAHVAWLARWGFEIEESQAVVVQKDSDFGQITVKTVPTLLADRLTTEDRTLQTVIRALLAHAEERGTSGHLRDVSWTTMMKHVPDAFLDLINSKACRGAIMFNDLLQDSQCRTLVAQLAETDFPFACAHGRPSMVPLVNVPNIGNSGNKRAIVNWAKARELAENN